MMKEETRSACGLRKKFSIWTRRILKFQEGTRLWSRSWILLTGGIIEWRIGAMRIIHGRGRKRLRSIGFYILLLGGTRTRIWISTTRSIGEIPTPTTTPTLLATHRVGGVGVTRPLVALVSVRRREGVQARSRRFVGTPTMVEAGVTYQEEDFKLVIEIVHR
jgi:hypothetical protein